MKEGDYSWSDPYGGDRGRVAPIRDNQFHGEISWRTNEVNGPRYDVYWNTDYTASRYAFDTTRKSDHVADAIQAGGANVALVNPNFVTEQTADLIRTVHLQDYVAAMETGEPESLATSQGFAWDPGILTMAVAHSAGLVAGVADVLSGPARVAGSLSSGLHHARADRGRGFCTFNGLAVAARAAVDRGAERVLILDLDAHCGGGTRSMTDPLHVVQIDVSTIGFDRWTPSNDDALLFADRTDYLGRVEEALVLADRAGPFDLVIYNAGMDPATDSDVSTADMGHREQRVADWVAGHDYPLVFALAGGYTNRFVSTEMLTDLHLATVRSFT